MNRDITKFKKFYKSLDKDKKMLYWVLVSSSLIILIFLIKLIFNGYFIVGNSLQMEATGQFGDFIGGVVGTIFSGLGFYFLYLTLVDQRISISNQNDAITNQKDAFEKERFEAKFFDLIKLHRDNIIDEKYNIYIDGEKIALEGRKVFNAIYKEFQECLAEVKRFCKIYDSSNCVKHDYKIKLNQIKKANNLQTTVEELALIDIAYTILFYGIGREGQILVKQKFLKKYNDDFCFKLIRFMQLKPSKKFTTEYSSWVKFKNYKISDLKIAFEEIFKNRNKEHFQYIIDGNNMVDNYSKIKYYGGHQHRLGHYYRHLFQTYKFLFLQNSINDEEKYFYGKTLRAQLSNYEQALLFVNSISSLGYKWELDCDYSKDSKPMRLITYFQLIKNVSGRRFVDLDYRDFYKKIKYEFEE